MGQMIWTERMRVGVDALDEDHKMLIRIINQLDAGTGSGAADNVVRQCLVALRRYAEFHFAREERVLTACDVPGMEEHKGEHKNFIAWMQGVADRFEKDPEEATVHIRDELLDYLRNWLTHHILIVDMEYRPFVEGKAKAREAAESFKAAEVWWSG